MAQVLVIADDLTGANATGVLLKKNGFDTYTGGLRLPGGAHRKPRH